MTHEQKQLLRAVPVAAVICGGVLAAQYCGMKDVMDRQAEVRDSQPVAGSQQFGEQLSRVRAAVGLTSLPTIEKQLEKDEEFVRKVEAAYALQAGGPPETRKERDAQVDKAIAAIGERQKFLKGTPGNALPDVDRAKVAAVEARCADLIKRLERCRKPDVPAETD